MASGSVVIGEAFVRLDVSTTTWARVSGVVTAPIRRTSFWGGGGGGGGDGGGGDSDGGSGVPRWWHVKSVTIFTLVPLVLSILTLKSTPIVEFICWSKLSSVNL